MDCIVNVTQNWGIGNENKLLVSISADLKRFRQLTLGKTVILGRKTLETFPHGRPLKNRENIILSTQSTYAVEGATVAHNVEEVLALCKKAENPCVIGGASVYELLLPYCHRALITKMEMTIPADTYFPDLDALSQWSVVSISDWENEEGIAFQYVEYANSSPVLF